MNEAFKAILEKKLEDESLDYDLFDTEEGEGFTLNIDTEFAGSITMLIAFVGGRNCVALISVNFITGVDQEKRRLLECINDVSARTVINFYCSDNGICAGMLLPFHERFCPDMVMAGVNFMSSAISTEYRELMRAAWS